MVPRSQREDLDPIIEVSARGTATADGEYLQHEAVLPHKPHAELLNPPTVIVRPDTSPPAGNQLLPNAVPGVKGRLAEETTAITKTHLRAASLRMLKFSMFIEAHRIETLALILGLLLFLIAGLLAVR